MPSLYLGRIAGERGSSWEVHAFTRDRAWREFGASEIADSDLFGKLRAGRFEVLKSGRAIYCTAVNPIADQQIETNPHDDRSGTAHVAALSEDGMIGCAVSVAVDLGESDGGQLIGLPLENRWQEGSYPRGASLNSFRERYLRIHYGEDRDIAPWEMVELYRHWKAPHLIPGEHARIGVYAGCFKLLIQYAKHAGRSSSWLWAFDAVPKYFQLYTFGGAGFLRDQSIADGPKFVAPTRRELRTETKGSRKVIVFDGNDVSRDVIVPVPEKTGEELTFRNDWVPFLGGVVDIRRKQKMIENGAVVPLLNGSSLPQS